MSFVFVDCEERPVVDLVVVVVVVVVVKKEPQSSKLKFEFEVSMPHTSST
jgi:hypothetical protein